MDRVVRRLAYRSPSDGTGRAPLRCQKSCDTYAARAASAMIGDMFADMFMNPAADPRVDPPSQADERTTLVSFLRWQRHTLELKCADLDAEQLSRRALEFSSLSLLGLLRHMADVERVWFKRRLGQQDVPPCFRTDADPDAAFNGAVADPGIVSEAWGAWRAEVAFAEQFVAEAPDLDIVGPDVRRGAVSLRWVLVHMIEEYARHNGHADLLRQRIDGRVGQ